MDPLYLVDGSGYIFRAYYAVAPLSTSNGLPTNAVLGFTRMLIKLLRDVDARYIAVTFDTGEPTFRHKMYSEYKANRDDCPEDLVPQMPYFRKVVKALGIASLEKPGFEADDIIATLATKLKSPDQPVVIVSGDKDLTQLVDDSVQMWDAMRDIRYDRDKVKEKFGVLPTQVLDFLSLTGDSSDNIPGVRGIGPKTAVSLIDHFGGIDQLMAEPHKIEEIQGLRGKASVQKKVESSLDELRLSRELVSLDTDVSPYNKISDVEEFHWQDGVPELFVPLCEELEFNKIVDSVVQLSPNPRQWRGGDVESDENRDFKIVTAKTFDDFIKDLSQVESFAFDTETTSLDVLTCELVGISISWSDHTAYYIPVGGQADKDQQLNAEDVRKSLLPIFSNPNIKKTGLNLKYDIGVLEEHGYEIAGVNFDAMLASYVLTPDRRQHSLSALAKNYLNESMLPFKELVGEHENIGQVELSKVAEYACHDADVSWRISNLLDEKLGVRASSKACSPNTPSLRQLFEDIEVPLVSVLSKMERAGIGVDLDFLKSLEGEFAAELETLRAEIHRLAGKEFNINSPKQLREILYEDMQIPTKGIKKTKSGFSTNAGVLQKLSGEYEIVDHILEYREVHKLISTYLEALQRLVHPKTGRIHASFNQAIAATGRLSSSEPNMQNIPIRTERGRRIRNAFIAAPGSTLISADYSQIELRVLAHLCEDKNLCRAFREGEDIHMATAREIFGEVSLAGGDVSHLRRVAKTINFGLIYGMGAFRLANELEISRRDAQNYIDSYFERYPNVQQYFDSVESSIEKLGYVETMFGRRRYLSDIDSSGRDSGFAIRALLNAPIQGSAAEIIKIAMINLAKVLEDYSGRAALVLQVHDELVLEVQESLVEELTKTVVHQMESAVELSVPLKVDVRSGTRWGGDE